MNPQTSGLPFVLIMFHLRCMRVERERLIMLALGVLMSARQDIRRGPITPGPQVRLALAVLFAFSRSGDRSRYDRFWRNLSEPHAGAGENAGNIWRNNEAHACFEWITRDVGAPGTVEYRARINHLLSGPLKHPWRRETSLQNPADDQGI